MNKAQTIIKKVGMEASYVTHRYATPPEFVSLLTTFHCNFRCQSCSIWKKPHHDELSEEQWLSIASDLAAALPATTFVEINGGEALIREQLIYGLIPELKKHFKTVALNSNGLLINQNKIQILEQRGVDVLKISFYSLDPETHNTLRGHPLAYTHAKQAIDIVTKSSLSLEVGILITKQNIKHIPKLIGYLSELPNTTMILQSLDESVESDASKGYGTTHLDQALWPEASDVRHFFQWIRDTKPALKNNLDALRAMEEYYLEPSRVLRYRCFAGQRNVVVYPNGDISLCFKGWPIGNITKTTLSELLRGEQAATVRKKISHCQKYCRIVGCNFSRGFYEYFRDIARIR